MSINGDGDIEWETKSPIDPRPFAIAGGGSKGTLGPDIDDETKLIDPEDDDIEWEEKGAPPPRRRD